MLYRGDGVPQNYADAAKWFSMIAGLDFKQVQRLDDKPVVTMYDQLMLAYGNHSYKWETDKYDPDNLRIASAQYHLGFMYWHGLGVSQDYGESVNWLRRSAEFGHEEAEYLLGMAYSSGQGIGQDHAEAVKWFRKAAEQGNADAQNSLGDVYSSGQGIGQDYAEAAKWYRKAAEQGMKWKRQYSSQN